MIKIEVRDNTISLLINDQPVGFLQSFNLSADVDKGTGATPVIFIQASLPKLYDCKETKDTQEEINQTAKLLESEGIKVNWIPFSSEG
jgi:hypothetical protein